MTEDTPSLVLAEPTDGRPAIFGGVPHRNPHFTGRISMLERLNATLHEGTSRTALIPHALHGLGGVGKTQLAIEYVYRYQSEYDLVWWIPAESVTLVRASLVELAKEMGLPIGAEVSQTVAMVLQALRIGKPYKRWLLVFDNAGDPQVIRPYLPVPAGHVLITSRDKRWAGVAFDIEVDVFTRAESVELLQRRGHAMVAADADVLADRLGDLPLALEQAAAWQAETGMSVTNFIHRFDERMNQLLGDSPPGYRDSVVATWSLSFDRLLEDSPAAAQLLQLAAFFGAEPISVAMLRDGRHAALPSPISQVLHDEIPLRRAIRDIGRYALARIDTRRDQIQIHRLVQAVLRDRLDSEAQEQIRDQVHAIMAAALPPDPDNQKYWERHAEFQGHVTKSGIIDAKTDEARRVALDQIRYRYVRGDYERSRDLGEIVARRWRETLGPDHELTLIAERHLANTLRALGERKRARELNQQTYATMQRAFGPDHEHTLATANSVGADLRIAGEFQAAKAFDVENLERHRRVFGDDDTNTLRTMNNLAVSLRLVGEYDEALRIDKAVLDGYLRWAGPTDPRTYSSISSVARDNFDRGKYTTARAVLEESLQNMRANLGDNGLWTLVSIRILAMALRRLGLLARSRQLAEEAYQTFRLLYTQTHEHVLSATVGYANILREVGERDQAETLINGALHDYRAEFGAEHPFALATAVDRAVTLRALGKYAEALAQDEEAQPMLRQSLGEDHPYTIKATINLANDYALTHDHQRARELSEMAYSISTSARGDDHPETLAAGLNSALDMLATGDRAPAAALLDEIQERYLQVYGREFPSTRIALDGRRIEQDIELPST